jgi:DNA-binding response OmpR family regulator
MSGTQKIVLVLEDDPLIGWEIRDVLEDAGYEVAGAFSTCAER